MAITEKLVMDFPDADGFRLDLAKNITSKPNG